MRRARVRGMLPVRRLHRASDRHALAPRLPQRRVRGHGGSPGPGGTPERRQVPPGLPRFSNARMLRMPRGMRPKRVLLRRVHVQRVVQAREAPLCRTRGWRTGPRRDRVRQPRQRNKRYLPARRASFARHSSPRRTQPLRRRRKGEGF